MELLDKQEDRNKQVNFKREVGRYLKKWPWFVLSMLVFYIGALVYLRYVQPQYLSKTSLMLLESKNKNTALSDLKNLGMGVSGDNELQGETTLIVSKPILSQVVKTLNLDVTFYSIGKIKEVELYDDAPFVGEVKALRDSVKFGGATVILKPAGGNSFRIEEGPSAGKTFAFGQVVDLPFGSVLLRMKPHAVFGEPIKVVFSNVKNVAARLESSVSVSLPENKGLLMELSLVGPVPRKSENILNELVKQYNIDGVKDKNQEAQNTQDFINGRLDVITQDLSGIEGEKEDFKRQNQITDLEAQANMAMSNANDNTTKLLAVSTQLDLTNSIYQASGKEQLLPTNMGLGSTDSYISEYNELLLTRNRVLKQATPANPAIIELNKQLSDARHLVRTSLNEKRAALQLELGTLQQQLQLNKDQIRKYPTREKVFRTIERQQQLKEQLYLYLLQKREENAITLAVTAPKSKVVNPAFTTGQVKPNRKQITTGALAAGFLLPLALLFAMNTLDTKVHSRLQINSLVPDIPVLAEIPVTKEENALVHPKDFSPFAESFRILTSNLKYVLKAKVAPSDPNLGPVILITSSIKGEGKTTVAMNIAQTLAWRSKILLMGADIRNPQLHRFIDGKNIGLTDYLVSEDTDPLRYVKNSGLSENLDVLFSGKIAPNPNDLLDMEKFDQLIARVREVYDYVIIDSAPLMLVSDTMNLIKHSDVAIYVVKSSFTEKEMLAFATEFKKNNNLKNMAFVLNAVEPQNSRYGKKYGYGYYTYSQEHGEKGWRAYFKK